MSTAYPAGIDTYIVPGPTETLGGSNPTHPQLHKNECDAITAIQTVLGVNPQGSFASVAARLANYNYLHTQSTPSTTWTINHNLNRYPSVSTIDSSGNLMYGAVQYTSLNTVVITFGAAISGTASLS